MAWYTEEQSGKDWDNRRMRPSLMGGTAVVVVVVAAAVVTVVVVAPSVPLPAA